MATQSYALILSMERKAFRQKISEKATCISSRQKRKERKDGRENIEQVKVTQSAQVHQREHSKRKTVKSLVHFSQSEVL